MGQFAFNLIKHMLMIWRPYGHDNEGTWRVFMSLLKGQREKEEGGPLKRGDKGTKVKLFLQNLLRLPFEEQIGFLSGFLNT